MGGPSNPVDCSRGWESAACREYQLLKSREPSIPTPDIANPKPATPQPLFSHDGWLYYWNRHFGKSGQRVAEYVFRILDANDTIPEDGLFDISTISRGEIKSFFDKVAVANKGDSEILGNMRDILMGYRSSWLRVHYIFEQDNQLIAVDEYGNVMSPYGETIEKAWEDIKRRYPDVKMARLVMDRQVFVGEGRDGLNPDRVGALAPLFYKADLAVTGGIGLFHSAGTIGVLPYSTNLDVLNPDPVGTGLMILSAAVLMLAALLGKRGSGGPVPVYATGGRTPLTQAPINIRLPEGIRGLIEGAKMTRGRDMPTVYMMGKPRGTVEGAHKGSQTKGVNMSKPEEELQRVQRNQPTTSGIYQQVVDMELQRIMDTQLRLQVDVSFGKHHNFFKRHGLENSQLVLDGGTGNGYFCCRLAKEHPRIIFTGVDLKEEMIRSSEETARMLRVSNTKWMIGDISKENFMKDEGEMFDGILLRYVDSHIQDVGGVLGTALRLLKPSGRLWIVTVELDHMHCQPPNETFDLYKRATEHLYRTFGIDGHRGSKLPLMLRKVGFEVEAVELDPMSNRELGTEAYQRFMLHEARLIREYDPEAISEADLKEIGYFVEEVVPLEEYYGVFGVVMIAARKRKTRKQLLERFL